MKIIQRCPACGQWAVAEYNGVLSGFFSRMREGWIGGIETASEVGGDIGESLGFGNEKISNITRTLGEGVGAFVGGDTGIVNALKNAVAGDKFQFVCDNCNSKWSTDNEKDDEARYYYHERSVVELKNLFASTEDYSGYIQKLEKSLQSEYNQNTSIAIIYDSMAAAYLMLEQHDKALQCINRSLELFDGDDNSHALKGLILGAGSNVYDAYNTMLELEPSLSDGFDNDFFKTELFHKSFTIAWEKFTNEFLSLPTDRRKFIYLTSYTSYIPSGILVLSIHSLPKGIEFKGGLSLEDTLYVMHPYKPNCYIPAKSFETELFRDEVDEFVHIMYCLGAKHIKYVDERSSKESSDNQHSYNLSGGGEYKGVGASAGYGQESTLKVDKTLSDKLEKGTDFDLNTSIKPYIPQNLVWFPQRDKWRDDCKSRLEGRFRKADFSITTSASEIISSSEKQNIEAEIKALNAAKGNAKFDSSDLQLSLNEFNHSWTCTVEFYPMSEYLAPVKVERSLQNDSSTDSPKLVSPLKKINWVVVSLGAIIACLAAALIFVLFF